MNLFEQNRGNNSSENGFSLLRFFLQFETIHLSLKNLLRTEGIKLFSGFVLYHIHVVYRITQISYRDSALIKYMMITHKDPIIRTKKKV